MRITQVLLSDRIGGAETLAKSLAKEWSEQGICNEIVYVDPPSLPLVGQPWARAMRLRETLAKAGSDVVLAHTAIPSVYARMSSPFRSLIYSVIHSASDDFVSGRLNIAERILRFRTDGIIAVSASQADRYRSRFGGSVPIHVIPNGIRREMGLSSSWDCEKGNHAPRTICAVARLVPQKNPELWIEAVSAMHQENPDMTAEWWGSAEDDEFRRSLQSEAAAVGLEGVFLGPTDRPEDVYRRCDILLHTSAREAHSVGLLEAAAMGVPIVCSEAVAATLPRDIHVATFRTDDRDDLISVLRTVVRDWDDKQAIARRQAVGVAQRHSVGDTARRYLDVFERGLSAHKGNETS